MPVPNGITTAPISEAMLAINWEIVPSFAAVYRGGPTQGIYDFTSSSGEKFHAEAGKTSHFVCVIGGNGDKRHLQQAWVDSASEKICFHNTPSGRPLNNDVQVEILDRDAGLRYARVIAANPKRVKFGVSTRPPGWRPRMHSIP